MIMPMLLVDFITKKPSAKYGANNYIRPCGQQQNKTADIIEDSTKTVHNASASPKNSIFSKNHPNIFEFVKTMEEEARDELKYLYDITNGRA